MGRLPRIAAEIGTADEIDEPLVTIGIRCQDDDGRQIRHMAIAAALLAG